MIINKRIIDLFFINKNINLLISTKTVYKLNELIQFETYSKQSEGSVEFYKKRYHLLHTYYQKKYCKNIRIYT